MAELEPTDAQIEEFLAKIRRPVYVWNMARGKISPPGWAVPDTHSTLVEDGRRAGAEKARARALDEVRTELKQLVLTSFGARPRMPDMADMETAHAVARQIIAARNPAEVMAALDELP